MKNFLIKFPGDQKLKNNYIKEYLNQHDNVIKQLKLESLESVKKIILQAISQKKNIFTAGNGGSASIANHLMCDYLKSIKINTRGASKPKVYSLCNSIELITAISNDDNYNKIFSFQLESLANKNDVVIIFSCSGSSKNIKNLLNSAKRMKCKTILFSGFKKSKTSTDHLNINLNCNNYGICEDVFSSLMHAIMQSIVYSKSKNKKILV
jgi:D-sedoheptulose 7-phosphate isomerase